MRLHNAMKQDKEDAQVRFGTMLTEYNLYAWALTPPTKISVVSMALLLEIDSFWT